MAYNNLKDTASDNNTLSLIETTDSKDHAKDSHTLGSHENQQPKEFLKIPSLFETLLSQLPELPDSQRKKTRTDTDSAFSQNPSFKKKKKKKKKSKKKKATQNTNRRDTKSDAQPFKRPSEAQAPQVCHFWKRGVCQNAHCPYLHSGPRQKVNEMCKFYKSGSCRKGDECIYSHEEPCRFFLAGNCRNGQACLFFHPSGDSQKQSDELQKNSPSPPESAPSHHTNDSIQLTNNNSSFVICHPTDINMLSNNTRNHPTNRTLVNENQTNNSCPDTTLILNNLDLRSAQKNANQSPPLERKKPVCEFYMQGFCLLKDNCPMSHEIIK